MSTNGVWICPQRWSTYACSGGSSGAADHVHLFFGLSRTLPVAKVVEIVKTSSSKWIKTKGPEFAQFHWQGDYGAFSVSQSDADADL